MAFDSAGSGESRKRRFTFEEGPSSGGASAPAASSSSFSSTGPWSQPASRPSNVVPARVVPSPSPQSANPWVQQLQAAWGAWSSGQGAGGWGSWGGAGWGAGGSGGGGAARPQGQAQAGAPPTIGSTMIGTVKSYSVLKGFGFLINPDIPQDIWFAKETVAAELRTSDLAGTAMSFELIRAPDGKPQARNLRPAPAGAGTPPPPVNPSLGLSPGLQTLPGMSPAFRGPALAPILRPGMVSLPGLGLRGATPMIGSLMAASAATLTGTMAPKRRAWSPHAGSRAIATASQEDGGPANPAGGPAKKPESEDERSRSSRSKSESSSKSSSEESKKKKKKKKKDKKKKKSKKSKKGGSSISSTSSEKSSRSRSRSRSVEASGSAASKKESETTSPAIEQAKMDALERLRKLQAIEPKDARAKAFRALLRDWHPDKNPEKQEVATAVFQFLQKGKSIINL
eukprot:TRINITY_DN47607_c0_g1_i1.p1 TRINITY_DN47607_c0_g1~~TRINITY_DN47607_c0_g1_i1.p1  ORF type:complete len:455 (+),score=79.49 TRINITY_DN47607_c0_g1_i1:164-1528(+)